MDTKGIRQDRSYWVVSPNLNCNEKTVSGWARASVLAKAAFMGWGNYHHIGRKFLRDVMPGDIVLIARRHKKHPEIVGCGVVRGKGNYRVKRAVIPEGEPFGSARRLRPFVNLTTARLPEYIPFISALTHSSALAQLHPDTNENHRRVCEWLSRRLSDEGKRRKTNAFERNQEPTARPNGIQIVPAPTNPRRVFDIRTKERVAKGKRGEAVLLDHYRRRLEWQGRELSALKWDRLKCDGFDGARKNLIEAKGTISRESIRMAVGELLDYAHLAGKKFRKLNKAILLPKRPTVDLEEWLGGLQIAVIWHDEQTFRDNAKGLFT